MAIFTKNKKMSSNEIDMIDVGLRYNDVILDLETIEKIIHVIEAIRLNGDATTFKTLKFKK